MALWNRECRKCRPGKAGGRGSSRRNIPAICVGFVNFRPGFPGQPRRTSESAPPTITSAVPEIRSRQTAAGPLARKRPPRSAIIA